MENIIVRSAIFEDLTTLLTFEQGIIAAERPFDDTLKPDPISYYDIGAMIKADHCEVVVAELNNEVVGSAYARIQHSKHYLKSDQQVYLGFMFVPPEHRGKGINQLIIDALSEWARSRNVTELRLDVYPDNLPAVRAYEKAGFSKYLLNMRLDITENK